MYATEELSQFRSLLAWKQAREVGSAKAFCYGDRIIHKCKFFRSSLAWIPPFLLHIPKRRGFLNSIIATGIREVCMVVVAAGTPKYP